MKQGKVYLVGAGPGDPGLITMRGAECLRQADLVLYDYLVNPILLDLAPDRAEKVCLGHHSTKRTMEQEEINRQTIEAARQGKTVVRLKGGDVEVFGRSAEERFALDEVGIAYELVPGITAAFAAAAYSGIPVTHSDCSSAVALVTGKERRGKAGPPLDYGRLADFPGTLVFYMGVRSAPKWTEALIQAGKSPKTPVAVVRRCSRSDQETFLCTLGTLVDEVRSERIRPPAVVIVGQVVQFTPQVSWFAGRPLFGQRILVTRPRHQTETLHRQLAALGAEVLVQPAITITEPEDWAPVDAALDRVSQYDWLVFSSANGVRFLLDRLCSGSRDLRALGGVRLAAIGPGTAEELARYRLSVDLMPEQYRAEALAADLARQADGKRFLLARASRGREVLAQQLTQSRGLVDQIVVYASSDVETPDAEVAREMADGEIDWVTITSSAIAHSVVRLFGEELRKVKLASISPITSAAIREAGHQPTVEAASYTMDGVVEAIRKFVP